jgi:hypothetical protein
MRDGVRFLCKVANGMYVAACGVPSLEESPAFAVMRRERLDLSNWVGCVPGGDVLTLGQLESTSAELMGQNLLS